MGDFMTGEWLDEVVLRVPARIGFVDQVWVDLDEPQHDFSEDGPYAGGMTDLSALSPIASTEDK